MSIFDTHSHLTPHQLRVVAEREELWMKLSKLENFIAGPGPYDELPQEDRELLCTQSRVMGDYVNVLDKRISRFQGFDRGVQRNENNEGDLVDNSGGYQSDVQAAQDGVAQTPNQ